MPLRRSARKQAEQAQQASDVIEIPSDSEPEAPDVEDEAPEPAIDNEEVADQPLLRAAGIKYKTDKLDEEKPEQDEETANGQQDQQDLSSSAKLAVRTRDAGPVKHRRVSIEIPLPTSSALRRREAEDGNQENATETPSGRKHITFDDSDYDEFVTPREAPSRDPLESSIPKPAENEEEEEDEEEESDDEAPEAVSTRVAEADTLKASEAAAKAAEQ